MCRNIIIYIKYNFISFSEPHEKLPLHDGVLYINMRNKVFVLHMLCETLSISPIDHMSYEFIFIIMETFVSFAFIIKMRCFDVLDPLYKILYRCRSRRLINDIIILN